MKPQDNTLQTSYLLLYQLARTWNQLDTSIIEPFLCKDVVYTSTWMDYRIGGASNYLSYLTEKFAAIRSTGSKTVTKARMANLAGPPARHCVLLTQISGSDIRQVLFRINTKNKQITHIFADAPENYENLRLSGEYP
jgi:hypothetical protein